MAEVFALRVPEDASHLSTLFRPDERLNDLLGPGGEDLAQSVLFGQDVWDLAGHPTWRDKAGVQTTISFREIAPRWRDAAKEFALLQMHPALAPERAPDVPMAAAWPHIQEPVTATTAQGNIKMLRYALRIIDTHQIVRFDSDDWDRVVHLLVQPHDTKEKQRGATLSALTGRGRAQQLIALWQVTQIGGPHDLLGTDRPFDGRETVELFGRKTARNTVRPHEDVGNVLGFVSWFFDHIADDIVDHVEWWAAQTDPEPPTTRAETFEAMLDLTARLADDNGGVLPGGLNQAGAVTIAAAPIARLLGLYDADEAYLAGRWAKSQLGDTVTYSLTASPCPLPLTELPARDGAPIAWAERLLAAKDGLDIWQRRLVYYAMYYLAATVMLRDSQLAVLPLDPVRTETITRPNGTSYVKHTLSAFKTKNRHVAVPTQVTVNGRVARIIALLQRLQQALGYTPERSPVTGQQFLFDQRLATPLGKQPRDLARDGLYLDLNFLSHMQHGARDLFDRGVISRHLEDVNLNMRQVRITCAQAYAIREHGQALAAAYGQWDTAAVAAGYVGDVYRLITPIDPADAEDLAQQDIGRRLTRTQVNRGGLTGSGLGRLDSVLEANKPALSNPQPLTPARLKSIGKRNPNIEQGPLTLCIYQPEGALCGGKGKPDFRLCLPGQCRNSVMSRADRARHELFRRQHVAIDAPVLHRAAAKMHDANPDIADEFADHDDEQLHALIAEHIDDYIQAGIEGTP